jgi:hypothetical protein
VAVATFLSAVFMDIRECVREFSPGRAAVGHAPARTLLRRATRR